MKSRLKHRIALGSAAMIAALSIGCSGGAERPAELGGTTGVDAGTPTTTCALGESRDCKIMIGQNGTVFSCYNGTQTCNGGAWGPCSGGGWMPAAHERDMDLGDAGAGNMSGDAGKRH